MRVLRTFRKIRLHRPVREADRVFICDCFAFLQEVQASVVFPFWVTATGGERTDRLHSGTHRILFSRWSGLSPKLRPHAIHSATSATAGLIFVTRVAGMKFASSPEDASAANTIAITSGS